ncbi:MAG TPA: autotransporter assembly complex family protein [Methylococcus sp.]|nr:autotransporter assembly complex family protein [Methylococcus sp.]
MCRATSLTHPGRLYAILWVLTAPAGPAAHAADPQPYTVTIGQTGDAQMDRAFVDSSMLFSLREVSPVGPFALVARAREDVDRFLTVLHSFGYYDGRVDVRVAGKTLDEPTLIEWLARAPAQPPVPVTVTLIPGPLFHLGKVELHGNIPEEVRERFELQPGGPARAADVLAAHEKLLEALHEKGYALARVDPPDAVLDPAAKRLDIAIRVDVGPRLDLGTIDLKGMEYVSESYLRRRLLVKSGKRFSPSAVETARRDLVATGLFSTVRVRVAEKPDEDGRLPLTFEVTERPRRAVGVNAAFSTDIGGSISASWLHRNLFGSGEQLNLTAGVSQLGGNSTIGIGYDAGVGFLKPDFLRRDQALAVNLGALKIGLDAYAQEAVTLSLLLKRKLSETWSGSVGLSGEQEAVTQQGITRDYTLLGVPLELKYDSTDSALDPTRGIRAAVTATPTQPVGGAGGNTFVLLQWAGSTYLDLGEPGRSVLALRGLIGDVQGAGQLEIPPDKRFYAGGSATIRGYKYQSIGPRFATNRPAGGTAVVAGTVEFRQRFLKDYGAVAFVDAGQVSADGPPFTGTIGVGVGVGARYYTVIGPIRLDVAVPLQRRPGTGSFELYIGIGQAF